MAEDRFTWRPLVGQAGTTNLVTVQVSDGGTPALSATNSFTVVVNPLASPAISAITVSGGQVVLTATGTIGPDYTVWASTNLVNWQALMTSNSPALPFRPFAFGVSSIKTLSPSMPRFSWHFAG